MKIVLAADHGGYELKEKIARTLAADSEVIDAGCFSGDSVDYPDFAEKAINHIISGECERGILICGTGIGMSISANRHKQIRAANCFNITTARLSREHNNANVLCLGARVLDQDLAIEMVGVWLKTEFSGGRHQRRIEKLSV